MAEVVEYRPRLNPAMEMIQVAAAQLISHLWNGRIGELVEPLVSAGLLGGDDMSHGVATLGLARGDRTDLLRPMMEDPPRYAVESWASADTWCGQAEAAAVVGDTAYAEELVGQLAPLTGRLSMSGISVVMGPVDGYLALALATTGRTEEAAAKADAAAVAGEGLGTRRPTSSGWTSAGLSSASDRLRPPGPQPTRAAPPSPAPRSSGRGPGAARAGGGRPGPPRGRGRPPGSP